MGQILKPSLISIHCYRYWRHSSEYSGELEIVTCHSPLHRSESQATAAAAPQYPLKSVQGGVYTCSTLCFGKNGRAGLQMFSGDFL